MAIELSDLVARLEQLEYQTQLAGAAKRSMLVTFDDGWVDSLELVPVCKRCEHLQPVVFLTASQLAGNQMDLPLPRLYRWCAESGRSLDELAQIGITRKRIKQMSEAEQHALLDGIGVPRATKPSDVLTPSQVRSLATDGWIIASHAHDHHDLRFDDPEVLLDGLTCAAVDMKAFGGQAWLAWPEGRCTVDTCDIARRAGFTLQFSLRVESGSIECDDLIHRDIWK